MNLCPDCGRTEIFMNEKTIAAISTPKGSGGIAVIRMSGNNAFEIIKKVYKGKENLSLVPSHTVHYGHITDGFGEIIDEVLVTVMRAPKTFTGEDVVEIGTHGGITASKAVLNSLIQNGAYPAGPGEFTKRAFLNGKMDLSEAEGVIDIINSKSELARKNALGQLSGKLSERIESIRKELISLSASMQVIIDYPDEDLEDITISDISDTAKKQKLSIEKLIESSKRGKLITEGILTAIVGKPNVGKSSLLNLLAGEERAIVTDIAGTTRDVIEESVNLDGVILRLMDTAGIRETDDEVEKIGVTRSLLSIEKADLVLVLLDASNKLSEEDFEILEKTKDAKRLIITNKTDISNICDIKEDVIPISAKTGAGIDELSKKIKELYEWGKLSSDDEPLITNMRHTAALFRASDALMRVIDAADMNMPSDILSIDLNEAIDALGEITGATVSEDIVAEIFHNFCVGK